MRTLLAFFAACLSAFGAITTDPPTIAQSMRGGVPYPVYATFTPKKTYITVSGTGAWTATRGGALGTTSCGQPCFTVSPASGTDAGTVTSAEPSPSREHGSVPERGRFGSVSNQHSSFRAVWKQQLLEHAPRVDQPEWSIRRLCQHHGVAGIRRRVGGLRRGDGSGRRSTGGCYPPSQNGGPINAGL